MIEEAIEIRTNDGTADGILYRAEGERRPGVIHLTDIGGIRPSHRELANRLAEKGYTVLVPNVFYRRPGSVTSSKRGRTRCCARAGC